MIKLLAGLSLALFNLIAEAQSFPARPVTLISPFPPGGSTDTTARIVAEAMRGAQWDNKWWPVIKAANIKVE